MSALMTAAIDAYPAGYGDPVQDDRLRVDGHLKAA